MPDCDNPADVLCGHHVQHLGNMRKRAAVLKILASRPENNLRPALDPAAVRPGDYQPLALRPGYVNPEFVPELPTEPFMRAQPCPADRVPSTLRSALKAAESNGWTHEVTLAIGPAPELITSVAFRARKDNIVLASRHEQPEGKPMSFKAAWGSKDNSLPIRLGWRELTAALAGADPWQIEVDAMRAAILVCFDAGLEFVSVL